MPALNILLQYTALGTSHDASECKPTPKCLCGTYDTVLLNIFEWVVTPHRHRMFWLHGHAGTGKTALAQTIAECCNKENKLAASFFFYRTKADRSNTC
jgi:NACHT domain